MRAIEDVVGSVVDLKKRGREWSGLCPFHSESTPSFTVYYGKDGKGRFRCFGCGAHGDEYDFVCQTQGVDFVTARRLVDGDEIPATAARASKRRKPEAPIWSPIIPVPAEAGPPDAVFNPNTDRVWGLTPQRADAYRDPDGRLVGYVMRYEFGDGRKATPQVTWCLNRETGEARWCSVGMPVPRWPLGCDQLAQRPDAPVLLVEGEKARHAAARMMPRHVVLTWAGGTNAVDKTDWSCITGRRLVLWPDADEPGIKAMHDIAGRLPGCELHWIDPAGLPKGYDAADAGEEVGWDTERLRSWARSRLSAYVAPLASDPDPEPAPEPATGRVVVDAEPVDLPAPVDPAARPVDWFSPLPLTSSDGKKPLSCIENLVDICQRLGVVLRYNVISKRIETLIPGQGFSMDNQANASLAWLMSQCARFRMPVGQLGDFMIYLADSNPYNPVANWIRSRPWDGTGRLQALAGTLTVEGEDDPASRAAELKYVLLVRWMISAVAAAFSPDGVSAHGVLVLQGEQYLGKTKWFKQLVPRELGVIRDGLSLRPDDKDSVFQILSNWIVELGELDATFRKSDISALKAFITRDRDELRRPYARLESEFARRTVFFASVNPRQFLHDESGNRRYWTLPCVAINHDHGLDMQQVWAEVYERLFLKGEGWYLTEAEMRLLNAHNEGFEALDPVTEKCQTTFDWQAPESSWRWLTATDIMLEMGFDRPSRADTTRCGMVIVRLNNNQRRRANGKNLQLVPPKLSSFSSGSVQPWLD